MKLRAAAFVLFGALLLSNGARASGPVELTPHVGVQIGGFATEGNRNVDIKTGVSYGFAADVRLKPAYVYLRASYHRVETSALVWMASELTASTVPLSQGHLFLGPMYEHSFGRIRVALGAGLGATHFTPHLGPVDLPSTSASGAAPFVPPPPYGQEWYFAAAIEAALKVGILENLGARVHSRLLMTGVSQGSELFCPDASRACDFNFGSDLLAQAELGAGVWWAF